jgi:hypothetical protein
MNITINLHLPQKCARPCKKSCISSGILTCFSQADLRYMYCMAFNGRDLRSYQIIVREASSGFNIIPAIIRHMCIPTWVKFRLFSRRKVILQISINHSEHVQSGCSSEKTHPGPFLTCGSVDGERRKCILKQCHFRVIAGWGKKVAGDFSPQRFVGSAREKPLYI